MAVVRNEGLEFFVRGIRGGKMTRFGGREGDLESGSRWAGTLKTDTVLMRSETRRIIS